jgi:dTDP-D-glucose 4,6-dehydratase
MNRVADNSRARELLGWSPKVAFVDGLHRTIDWYFGHKDPDEVRSVLDGGGLIARSVVTPASLPLS